MTDLKMAVAWLDSGQYLVKHDESTYSVRTTDFAPETDELRRVLLDALRWVPCSERLPTDDDADEKGNVLCYWTDEAIETYQARWIEEWNSDRNHKDKITHWRPLPPKPEGKG